MNDKDNFTNAQATPEKAHEDTRDMEEAIIQKAASQAMKKQEFIDSDSLISPDDLNFLKVK